MDALFLSPSYPIKMTPIDSTLRDAVGGGAFSTLNKWPYPLNEFTLSLDSRDAEASEQLYAFYLRHRADTPFLFDGAGRCEIVHPELFFIGDGDTVEFQLPFPHALAPTWVFYVNDAIESGWTMIGETGLVVFDTAPALHAQIKGKGRRLAKCLFWSDGERAMESEEFAFQVFRNGVTLREVV